MLPYGVGCLVARVLVLLQRVANERQYVSISFGSDDLIDIILGSPSPDRSLRSQSSFSERTWVGVGSGMCVTCVIVLLF